jgi:mutator protein MutT
VEEPLPEKTIEIAIGLIWRDGQLLIARRPEGVHLAGLWEFPGGKIRPKEDAEAAVIREAAEELAVRIAVDGEREILAFTYPERRVRLHVLECRWIEGEPRALGCAEWRWVAPGDLAHYSFPPANAPLIVTLAACGSPLNAEEGDGLKCNRRRQSAPRAASREQERSDHA